MLIEEWRKRIDAVDEQLVRLLSVRAQLAIEVGRTKREKGLDLHDPARELEIIHRAIVANPGVLEEEALTRLFQAILIESRRAAEKATDPDTEAGS